MKKILFLTYASLFLATSIQAMKPSLPIAMFKQLAKHYKNHSGNPSPVPKIDPDVAGDALATFFCDNDKDTALFLLNEQVAKPNHIVTPELVDMLQNISTTHTSQAEDERPFSKLRDHETSKQDEGVPVFYLAKEFDLIKACIHHGADLSLSYRIPTQYGIHYGNIITYLIDNLRYFDNSHYCAELLALYLKHGAGPYAPSYKSKGGSSLHHLVHVLSTANDPDTTRLYECASSLLKFESNLLHDRDHHGKTPGNYLQSIKDAQNREDDKARFQVFLKLFEHAASLKNISRE